MSSQNKIYRMILSSMCLAVAMVLPFLTGQIPEIGNMLLPMHIPVLLCGFFCGPLYGMAVGIIAPLLRFILFGMPPLMPTGIAMCAELGTYGLVSGLLYGMLPRKDAFVYVSLIGAMVAGRIVWGVTRVVLYGLGSSEFGWAAFMAGALLNALPGIVVQLGLIPLLVLLLKKYTIRPGPSLHGKKQ